MIRLNVDWSLGHFCPLTIQIKFIQTRRLHPQQSWHCFVQFYSTHDNSFKSRIHCVCSLLAATTWEIGLLNCSKWETVDFWHARNPIGHPQPWLLMIQAIYSTTGSPQTAHQMTTDIAVICLILKLIGGKIWTIKCLPGFSDNGADNCQKYVSQPDQICQSACAYHAGCVNPEISFCPSLSSLACREVHQTASGETNTP